MGLRIHGGAFLFLCFQTQRAPSLKAALCAQKYRQTEIAKTNRRTVATKVGSALHAGIGYYVAAERLALAGTRVSK